MTNSADATLCSICRPSQTTPALTPTFHDAVLPRAHRVLAYVWKPTHTLLIGRAADCRARSDECANSSLPRSQLERPSFSVCLLSLLWCFRKPACMRCRLSLGPTSSLGSGLYLLVQTILYEPARSRVRPRSARPAPDRDLVRIDQ